MVARTIIALDNHINFMVVPTYVNHTHKWVRERSHTVPDRAGPVLR